LTLVLALHLLFSTSRLPKASVGKPSALGN
jgi:hypothetical protein